MIGLLEFHVALPEILLTTCVDQLLVNLNLIKLLSACAKQNTAVKSANDTCSLSGKRHYLI